MEKGTIRKKARRKTRMGGERNVPSWLVSRKGWMTATGEGHNMHS